MSKRQGEYVDLSRSAFNSYGDWDSSSSAFDLADIRTFHLIIKIISNYCKMNLQRYEYFIKNDFQDFEFFSEGPNGRIKKAVRFTKLTGEEPFLYNLGFGDVSETTGNIDDTARSNNNDRDMVLATVARTVIDFTNAHGNHYIFATGSTPVRTRLYQIGISKLWDEISVDFIVQGYVDGNWRPFEKDVNYEAFLVKRKQIGTFEI